MTGSCECGNETSDLLICEKRGISGLAANQLASQEGLYSME